jgi:hypothetical protein
MEVDIILILKIVLLAFIHWMLVPLALKALIERKHVLGGKKAPWAVAIIFLTCIGSLIYLTVHPNFGVGPETQTEIM